MSPASAVLDLVEELRLRRWARENYVAGEIRDPAWHAVIHDEMGRRDAELITPVLCRRQEIVPLPPGALSGDVSHGLRGPLGAAAYAAGELHYT